MYSIVDIETTGNGIRGNRITEIAIFRTDGERVIDSYSSLVNPQCPIPSFITGLTGIDDEMVRDAPLLEELAGEIDSFLSGSIFVAHSVNFDYKVIQNEWKELGRDFRMKRLCTVRLSRQVFPGYRSYSLGKLCNSLQIPLRDRHRAAGDAEATTELFHRILRHESSVSIIKTFLNARSQEQTLPPSLPREDYEALPTTPGVYYFRDANGKIIYVGKAINLKKRVLSHFYDKSDKEVRLCRETSGIDFEESGNELLALLMESAAIKHHFPKYNRAQKKNIIPYSIFSYEDRNGIRHLAWNKSRFVQQPLATYYSTTDCRLFLEQVCKEFSLCPKYCHLQENVAHCSHFRIADCQGICRDEESVEAYNERVATAIASLQAGKEDRIIREKGRNPNEEAVIYLQQGSYAGYGFVPRDAHINTTEDLMAYIQPQKNTLETEKLVQGFLLKGKAVGVRFEV